MTFVLFFSLPAHIGNKNLRKSILALTLQSVLTPYPLPASLPINNSGMVGHKKGTKFSH